LAGKGSIVQLVCGRFIVDLSTPKVMGVLNVTPDSFSDGGRFTARESAVDHALRMVEEGAAIIDVGGESTRPGAGELSEAEELRRVIPVVEALAPRLSVPISVDTSKAAVMRAAIEAGATMINDVYALRLPGALQAVASAQVGLCLMHMQGEPRNMQLAPRYADVVAEVRQFLEARATACRAAGVADDRLAVDPGFGFGKTLEHNLQLLDRLDEAAPPNLSLLVGLSRKGMIGTITGRPLEARGYGSAACAAIAVLKGARLVRAHEVAATLDAVRIAAAVATGRGPMGGSS
jgi:dihydropteroate synthase